MHGAYMCARTSTATGSQVCVHVCMYVPVFVCESYQVCVHVYTMWFIGLSTCLHISLSELSL